jgi:hypothetical protein
MLYLIRTLPLWNIVVVGLFLLGIYIFGKNFNLLNMFIGTRTVGDCLLLCEVLKINCTKMVQL